MKRKVNAEVFDAILFGLENGLFEAEITRDNGKIHISLTEDGELHDDRRKQLRRKLEEFAE